jgi:NAD(P)-dependent dehydrogenase (short-subunit alcohol dehydrogenase family)
MKKQRWTAEQIGDQTGRVAIVTGANTGIGLEAARELARKGATVTIASRNEGKAENAANNIKRDQPAGDVVVMVLDLADLNSVRIFAREFRGRFDRLDLLVNNAGVMMPPESKTADGFELQFGTNHLGHFALTGVLLDLLLNTEGSRIVNVSSSAHRYGEIDFEDLNWEKRQYKEMASYGQSKLANMLFTLELQKRLEKSGAATLAVSCHPGWTGTDLQRHSGFLRFLNPVFSMKPWQGALPTLYAAVSDEVVGTGYYGPDGFMQMRGYPTLTEPKETAKDLAVAKRLWQESEKMTGVTFDFRSSEEESSS